MHLGDLLQRAQSPTRNVSNVEVIVVILESRVSFLTFRVHHPTLALSSPTWLKEAPNQGYNHV